MTLATAGAPPSLLTQVGMAGTSAVITVSFIHPIDVVKVSFSSRINLRIGYESSFRFECLITNGDFISDVYFLYF